MSEGRSHLLPEPVACGSGSVVGGRACIGIANSFAAPDLGVHARSTSGGANFPSWLFCAICGAIVTIAIRPVFVVTRVEAYL